MLAVRVTSNSGVQSVVKVTNLSKETWKILRTFYFADALSTSTLRGLDNDWITNFLSPLQRKHPIT